MSGHISGGQLRAALRGLFGEGWQKKAAYAFGRDPATVRRWCNRRIIPKIVQLAYERLTMYPHTDDVLRR